MSAFFEVCKDVDSGPQGAFQIFMPDMLNFVLVDYKNSPSTARDSKVLHTFATAVAVFKEGIAGEIPLIMEAIFEPTLELITANMQDHPEHRVGFFNFLRQAIEHGFYGLFNIPPLQQKLVVDSIVWAFKHTERNISEMGLEILYELLQKISATPQICDSFYQSSLMLLVNEVFGILTDRLHKSGFKLQVSILMHLFHTVQLNHVVSPLFDPATNAGIFDNAQYLRERVVALLGDAFPNLNFNQVSKFVVGLFDTTKDLNNFKEHVRDFLITVKEFAAEDNSDLYAEEREATLELSKSEQWQYRASVPGLLKPDELDFENNAFDS